MTVATIAPTIIAANIFSTIPMSATTENALVFIMLAPRSRLRITNRRITAFILPKWHNICSIAVISYYSLVTFEIELSKCFGYPFLYTIKVSKILFFGGIYCNYFRRSKGIRGLFSTFDKKTRQRSVA